MATGVSKQEADEHLRDIRRRKGVDESNGQHADNIRDLDRALSILSDQLYQKPTHFLLELIQNADDNHFDAAEVPMIWFDLKQSRDAWKLGIDCNEVGFEKENVEALCRIGDSTKKARDRTKGYIGEKGIGFKSVFKVADVVHISSKNYCFRFDRKGVLGMITPVIETFPEILEDNTLPRTRILLDLRGKSEFQNINDELRKLEPQILIFLRKMCRMCICTPDRSSVFVMEKVTEDGDFDGRETVTLEDLSLIGPGDTTTKYLIMRRIETSLPPEERRPNVEETEIVLAFPVDKSMRPLLQHSQQTYAYLPIGDYGFNYLIQADFLLVANRENLDSSKWNENLLEGVYRAFVNNAVTRFNSSWRSGNSTLRYAWPLFLKDRGGTSELWSKLKRRIFQHLSTAKVLESRLGHFLECPKYLFYVPGEFRLNGEPLVEDETTKSHHLSFSYDSEIGIILPELKKMGVNIFGFFDFYRELNSIISNPGNAFFKSQSKQWHSKVSALLQCHGARTLLSNLPIIPLRDGQWVTPSQSHLFLEENAFGASIPGGINICLVDAEACQDPKRRAFFEWLRIKKCDQTEVCRMIMECYTPFHGRSLNQSVQDLLYLFQAPSSVYNKSFDQYQLIRAPPFPPDFSYCKRFYIEEPDITSIISKYAVNIESNMLRIHPRYLEEIRKLGKESEFVKWASSRLKVSTHPRLVDEQGRLTLEFKFLAANATNDLLLLLRDHWGRYSGQIENSRTLKAAISELMVNCKDGASRRLNQTAIPYSWMMLWGPHVPFIEIPDPRTDSRWFKFSVFGLLVNNSTEFYLRELKAFAALPVTVSTSKSAVQAVYIRLEKAILTEQNNATSSQLEFEREPLVFIDRLRKWISLGECVWSGPPLSSVHALNSEYPESKTLFRTYLRLGNVSRDHVIKELLQTTSNTSFDRLQELLLLLNKYLDLKTPKDCLSELKWRRIIPVRKKDGELCRMDYNDDIWYVPDRQNLLDSFRGRLPLIAFEVNTARRLMPLFGAMGLRNRLLSQADQKTMETVGVKIFDEMKTLEFRTRVKYFALLITEETAESKARILDRLGKLKVWGAASIKVRHKIGDVLGAAETGNVVFDDANDDTLNINLLLDGSQKRMIDFELYEAFVRYCGITDSKLEKLVYPILTYPLEAIETFLEQHGLDHLEEEPDTTASLSEESDEEHTPVLQINAAIVTSRRLPNSDTNIPSQESDVGASAPSNILRESIPELAQNLASVRTMASRPSMAPTLIITSSRTGINSAYLTSTTATSETQVSHSTPRNEGFSPGIEANVAEQSATSPAESGPRVASAAFDLSDLTSSLPNLVGVETHSRISRSSLGFHPSTSRFGQGPYTVRREPDLESTVYGLHRQHVGLLGETFVNEWFSGQLQHDWDATRHWTSRNRNYVFTEQLFEGREKDHADFTYLDHDGNLTSLLARHGFLHAPEAWVTNPPIYHLEVKSTTGVCEEPFFMSNNQVDKARRYSISWNNDRTPDNVYAVVRVYNLEKQTEPGFTIYVDPWTMYLKDELTFLAENSYVVSPNPERP